MTLRQSLVLEIELLSYLADEMLFRTGLRMPAATSTAAAAAAMLQLPIQGRAGEKALKKKKEQKEH